ncbi:hypothetical protein [Novosphingobium beihaiensis]|uniref:Uncharacterized protein n=1 Tax=Novosphingobium beihaiensis TaxID=2930389 RepID=A0ABT0BSY9_9SPHN|nr:hypothetical protein [Novosphingobium beihaiensis]MCJ2187784.1 hypothetical protein [Novosphingobium beihaiensis]
MEFLFELLFQFLGELLLQFLVELFAEMGMHAMGQVFSRRPSPRLAVAGFTLWGIVAGAISLVVFPHSAIHNPALRLANLFLTPLLAGGGMLLLGRLRAKKGQDLVRLDRFGYAFLFAFTMALMRYNWAG